MEYSYYLIYKEGRKGGEILFNVGTKERTSTLIRLSGQRAREMFDGILEILGRVGCVTPIQTGDKKVYSLRDDVGPVIGAYLVLTRRARKTDYWISLLEELLIGRLSRLGGTFATLLEAMVELSKGAPSRRYALSPHVVSSFSSALKVLTKSLLKGGWGI